MREWYRENKEKINAKRREMRKLCPKVPTEEQRIRRRENVKRHRIKHRERILERRKLMRQTPEARAKHAAYEKAWRARNPLQAKAASKQAYRRFRTRVEAGDADALLAQARTLQYQKEWARENRHRRKEARLRYYASEKGKAKTKAYTAKYKALGLRKAVEVRWRSKPENKEKMAATHRAYMQANPGLATYYAQRRRTLKLNAIHPDHNYEEELEMVKWCQRLKRHTGETWSIDHIIPLKHGGWHVNANLQIMPSRLNSSKSSNPFWSAPDAGVMRPYRTWRDVPEIYWPEQLAETYREIAAIEAERQPDAA